MNKSRFTEAQITGVLREQEAGGATAEVCRRHGISDQTFDRWKARYSGMSVSDARKLKALEDENRWLKKRLAESIGNKRSGAAVRREAALRLITPRGCATSSGRNVCPCFPDLRRARGAKRH